MTNDNQCEIAIVPKHLRLITTIEPELIQKARGICNFLNSTTNSCIYLFNNIKDKRIEIYTDKNGLKEARKNLLEFECEYQMSINKRRKIINYRHKRV